MKPTITWILLAGGAHAQVVQNDGPGKGVSAVKGATWDQHLAKDQEIMADRPGRSFDRMGDQRHSMEPTSDPKRLQESAFLGEVCGYLTEAGREGRFDRLVLVAEPRALGLLRKQLGGGLKDKVYAELDKDLSKVPLKELPERLKDVILL